jgi:DNA (cytosine-5)-methyltransferase 1
MEKLKVVDLFSGCGGFSYGFEQEEYEIILGVDNWSSALDTFRYNHKNSETLNLDLHDRDSISLIEKHLGNEKIDVLIAGPPCQGFSLTGTRNINDERNSLFESVFNLSRKIDPKVLVIENVQGILTLYNGETKNKIIEEAELLGYNVSYQTIYAPDYGIPQIRKRVFFVMSKYPGFEFPKKTFKVENYVTSGDAIGDLHDFRNNDYGSEESEYELSPSSLYQRNMRKSSNKLFNHVGTKHKDHVIEVIKQVPEGGNHKDLPKGVGDSRKFNEAWTRYDRDKPSKTIDTGHRNHFHYEFNRVPTVRENARLQSFPDTFKFLGTKTDQNRQVGNAVPPILGQEIAKSISSHLEKQ